MIARHLVLAVLATWFAVWPLAARSQEMLHGADAIFHGGGLTIAWAVARDRDDTKTAVMIRVVDQTKRYRAIEIDGIDPFTQKTEIVRPRQALDGIGEIVLPRSRFAELPRTELRFYAANAPALTVYYLGVPDTTPEFADATAARGYLVQTTEK
jgi:hypothetical protein